MIGVFCWAYLILFVGLLYILDHSFFDCASQREAEEIYGKIRAVAGQEEVCLLETPSSSISPGYSSATPLCRSFIPWEHPESLCPQVANHGSSWMEMCMRQPEPQDSIVLPDLRSLLGNWTSLVSCKGNRSFWGMGSLARFQHRLGLDATPRLETEEKPPWSAQESSGPITTTTACLACPTWGQGQRKRTTKREARQREEQATGCCEDSSCTQCSFSDFGDRMEKTCRCTYIHSFIHGNPFCQRTTATGIDDGLTQQLGSPAIQYAGCHEGSGSEERADCLPQDACSCVGPDQMQEKGHRDADCKKTASRSLEIFPCGCHFKMGKIHQRVQGGRREAGCIGHRGTEQPSPCQRGRQECGRLHGKDWRSDRQLWRGRDCGHGDRLPSTSATRNCLNDRDHHGAEDPGLRAHRYGGSGQETSSDRPLRIRSSGNSSRPSQPRRHGAFWWGRWMMTCQYFHQWPIGPATDAVVAKWTHPVVHQSNFISEWAAVWNAFLDRGPAFYMETSPEYGLASSWATRRSCSRSRPPRSSQLLQVTFDDNLEVRFVGDSEFQATTNMTLNALQTWQDKPWSLEVGLEPRDEETHAVSGGDLPQNTGGTTHPLLHWEPGPGWNDKARRLHVATTHTWSHPANGYCDDSEPRSSFADGHSTRYTQRRSLNSNDIPSWVTEVWDHVFSPQCELDPPDDLPEITLVSWYLDHHRCRECRDSRMLFLHGDPTMWEEDLIHTWQDRFLRHAPYKVYIVHPEPPRSSLQFHQAQVIVVQHESEDCSVVVASLTDKHPGHKQLRQAALVTPCVTNAPAIMRAFRPNPALNLDNSWVYVDDRIIHFEPFHLRSGDSIVIHHSGPRPLDETSLTERHRTFLEQVAPDHEQEPEDHIVLMQRPMQEQLARAILLAGQPTEGPLAQITDFTYENILQCISTQAAPSPVTTAMPNAIVNLRTFFQASNAAEGARPDNSVTTWFLNHVNHPLCNQPRIVALGNN